MRRTLDFINDNPSEVKLNGNLQLILWAGDCVHNGITDIERLPDFDVYLCFGYNQTIQANIDYMNSRTNPGVICIIDITDKNQMDRFINIFRGRFSVINSDYNGNTPKLPLKYYKELLCKDGKAFNIDGINGCIMPTEDYHNTLELFAPILSKEDNHKRHWTREILELAKENNITPGEAWASPDFKHSYYDTIRHKQFQLIEWNKERNPVKSEIWKYSESNIEEYWKLLPLHILTVNFERMNVINDSYKIYVNMNSDRFRSFILECIIPYLDNIEELREYSKTSSIHELQKIYKLCKEYPGIKFAYMVDTRTGKNVYSHWIEA
uniref:Uncharacterized protein n=1 Tax=viral metagenome TaxID=1070528 RepID=A0A6C0DJJ7_9ZZZZ